MASVAGIQALITGPASSGVAGSADRATAGSDGNAFASQLRQNATSETDASGGRFERANRSSGKNTGYTSRSSSDVASAAQEKVSRAINQQTQMSGPSGTEKSGNLTKGDSESASTSSGAGGADQADGGARSDIDATKNKTTAQSGSASSDTSDTTDTASSGDVTVDPALQANLQAAAAQALPQDVSVSDGTVSSTSDTSDSSDTQVTDTTDATDAQAVSLLSAMFTAPGVPPAVSASVTATATTSDTADITSVISGMSGGAALPSALAGASSTDTTDAASIALTDGTSGQVDVSASDAESSGIPDMGRFAGLMRSSGRSGGSGSDSTSAPATTTVSPADASASGTTATSAVDMSATPSSMLTSAVVPQAGIPPLANGPAGLVSAKLTVSAQTASGSDEVSSLDTLGLSIAARVSDGVKHFAIRLDPPELGRVEVKLSVDRSGQATATLVAEKPHTLSLLQQDAGNLARTLQDAGMNLSSGGLNFSLSSGQNQNGSSDRNSGGQSLQAVATVDSESDASSSSYLGLDSDDVRLDIKV